MKREIHCPRCNWLLIERNEVCPNCGQTIPEDILLQLPDHQVSTPLISRSGASLGHPKPDEALPRTIQELLSFCNQNGMPLEKMRFFIGVDYRYPMAFGIYKDGNDYIVYKNKSNGERAIRYRGPDEAFAVKELYLKLMDECHMRGIYPDCISEQRKDTWRMATSLEAKEDARKHAEMIRKEYEAETKASRKRTILIAIVILIIIIIQIYAASQNTSSSRDGSRPGIFIIYEFVFHPVSKQSAQSAFSGSVESAY